MYIHAYHTHVLHIHKTWMTCTYTYTCPAHTQNMHDMHIHIHACHTHAHTCMPYACTYMHVIHIHIHACHTHAHICMSYTCTRTCTCTCTCTYCHAHMTCMNLWNKQTTNTRPNLVEMLAFVTVIQFAFPPMFLCEFLWALLYVCVCAWQKIEIKKNK